MRLRLVSSIVLFLFLLSACQPAASSLPDVQKPVEKTEDYQYIFTPPTDPAEVEVALDESLAVEKIIPIEGGTLSTTGKDGTQYNLEIPGDALLVETNIRMIPAAVSSLPFGGEQTLAVQLEPEGLFFNNYATLTITPAQEIPVKEQLFFGYQANGRDVGFAPPVVESKEIKIKLLHFSGYGVTRGLLADPESVRQRLGGDAERRIQSLASEMLGRERQRQLLGGEESSTDSDVWETLSGLFERFEKEVVEVRVAAAGESCAAGRLALQTVLGLERQKQLLGSSDGEGLSKYAGLMDTVSSTCLKEEYEMCAQDHVIHRMIPVWLGMERQRQLLGMSDAPGASAIAKEAEDLTKKCLTFELQFESQATFDDGGGGGFDSSVKARIPLRFNTSTMKIEGSSALINNAFEFKAQGCTVTSNRGGSTFSVMSLVYIPDTHSPNDALGYVRDFNLTYFPDPTKESFTVVCEDQPPYTSPESAMWWGEYLVLHKDEISAGEGDGSSQPPAQPPAPDMTAMLAAAQSGVMMPVFAIPAVSPGGGFVAEDWEVTGGEYFAKKEWIKEDASLGLVEAGTLKLYHRPGQ